MSYLLDKKIKKKKFINIALGVVLLLILFYFRVSVFNGLSRASQYIFHPVFVLGNNVGNSLKNVDAFFYSKKALLAENENLKAQIAESAADRANYASVVDENNKMQEILGRMAGKTNMILAGILTKPNRSPYDTLLIDAGMKEGVVVDQRVFAFGNVSIGKVAEVYPDSSKVILFSNPGEITEVVIPPKDVFMQAVGRGGGNFEIVLPKDFVIANGAEVDLPGVTPYILGTVQTIISDPRDAFEKALLASPVNIEELKLVEVEE